MLCASEAECPVPMMVSATEEEDWIYSKLVLAPSVSQVQRWARMARDCHSAPGVEKGGQELGAKVRRYPRAGKKRHRLGHAPGIRAQRKGHIFWQGVYRGDCWKCGNGGRGGECWKCGKVGRWQHECRL